MLITKPLRDEDVEVTQDTASALGAELRGVSIVAIEQHPQGNTTEEFNGQHSSCGDRPGDNRRKLSHLRVRLDEIRGQPTTATLPSSTRTQKSITNASSPSLRHTYTSAPAPPLRPLARDFVVALDWTLSFQRRVLRSSREHASEDTNSKSPSENSTGPDTESARGVELWSMVRERMISTPEPMSRAQEMWSSVLDAAQNQLAISKTELEEEEVAHSIWWVP